MIDSKGFRHGIGIIIINDQQQVFWAKRINQDAWQFPQGGLHDGESVEEAMYRELREEVGLAADDVQIIAQTRQWLYYRLPRKMIRRHQKPLCIGQKQKWFLLKPTTSIVERVNFATTNSPEFDDWRWVDYWHPLAHVIKFKRKVYQKALDELSSKALSNNTGMRNRLFGRRNRQKQKD